ncbi:uncharacterized protein LOC134180395 [Corticium candelabrum]|uniref:uncharacterized protein LOC134180395 n=1 Tax=Corticium candelabrum TaxID=121492 RepID=UPI002E26FE01|nr:uncharacterized protein LOC134180395 [Corticium candelabrum]
MRDVVYLFISWLSLSGGTSSMVHSRAVSSDSTGTLNNKWNLVKDRHRQAEKNFIGAEVKPQLNQSSSDPNTDGIAHDSGLSSGRPVKLQSSASNRQSVFSFKPICSPEFYVVTLSHGTCTRKVVTKMCYGHCTSYTVPAKRGRTGFQSDKEALHGLTNVCNCCASLPNSRTSRRYDVICFIAGRKSKKSFHVPHVNRCNCRPCYVP